MKTRRKTGRIWAALLSLAMVASMFVVPASAITNENSEEMVHDYVNWLDFDQEILYVDWERYQAHIGLDLVTFYRPIVYVPLGTVVKVKGPDQYCMTHDFKTKIRIIDGLFSQESIDSFVENSSYLSIEIFSENPMKFGVYNYKNISVWADETISCEYTLYIVGVDKNKALPYDPEVDPKTYVSYFSDVSKLDYFRRAVDWAFKNGIANGTSATTFSPNSTCNCAQILSFLWRANGSPEPSVNNPFANISTKDYYYKAVIWAYEKGLISGAQFNPKEPCTRSMVVTYLWKLAGKPSVNASDFTDVPANADYAQAVAWAVSEGITAGTSKTTFSPDATCTRGQIVTFLYRAMGK